MGISWSDEDRLNDMLKEGSDYMKAHGEPIPDDSTQKVPEYFDTGRAAMRYFTQVYYKTSPETKKRLYGQKFVIGTGEPFSYAERKRKPLVDPENPFTTMKGEGEDMVINWVLNNKDKVGLARGGRLTELSQADRKYILNHGTLPGTMLKRGLGGDILGAVGNYVAPGWGQHLGRGVGDALQSYFGYRRGGRLAGKF
jgi:hypothetical protein